MITLFAAEMNNPSFNICRQILLYLSGIIQMCKGVSSDITLFDMIYYTILAHERLRNRLINPFTSVDSHDPTVRRKESSLEIFD